MTRKDYILLAVAVARAKGWTDEKTRWVIAFEVAHVLKGDNGNFDYHRFMKAAEVPYPPRKPEPEGHGWRPRKTKVR